jgi:hypothetical protein
MAGRTQLKWCYSLHPLRFTEEERAALEADRQAQRQWGLAYFDERAEGLRKVWDGEGTSRREGCDERR